MKMNDTRKKVLLIPGEVVSCNMALFEILEILDFNSIVAKNLEDGSVRRQIILDHSPHKLRDTLIHFV